MYLHYAEHGLDHSFRSISQKIFLISVTCRQVMASPEAYWCEEEARKLNLKGKAPPSIIIQGCNHLLSVLLYIDASIKVLSGMSKLSRKLKASIWNKPSKKLFKRSLVNNVFGRKVMSSSCITYSLSIKQEILYTNIKPFLEDWYWGACSKEEL